MKRAAVFTILGIMLLTTVSAGDSQPEICHQLLSFYLNHTNENLVVSYTEWDIINLRGNLSSELAIALPVYELKEYLNNYPTNCKDYLETLRTTGSGAPSEPPILKQIRDFVNWVAYQISPTNQSQGYLIMEGAILVIIILIFYRDNLFSSNKSNGYYR